MKINLGKCKAVWIGRNRFRKEKICSDLKLQWSDSFTLLGVDFDSDLAKMDTNFKAKIEEIEKVYSSWLYRNVTPLGKITVIKSIALSKLSHVVLVCPHLGPDKLALLTQMSYKFLWSNKPDRIKRVDTVLPISSGGLNMPDIQSFWESLKCSWARRLTNHEGSWQKILQANVLAAGFDMDDILFGGPELLKKCAALLTNKFWKETLNIFGKLQSEITFYRPDFFYNINIFGNNFLRLGDRAIKKSEFPKLWYKGIRQVGDLFDCSFSPPKLLNWNEFNQRFGLNIDFLSFHRIKTCIELGAKNLNNKIFDINLSDTQLPRLPILIKIAIAQKKGGTFFYNTLTSKENLKNNTMRSELKWHEKLGTVLSVNFWDNILRLPQKMLVTNRIVWMQIQINKHLLPTNYTVSHYDRTVSPLCSLCSLHNEELHSLLWGCQVVRQFWQMVGNTIGNYYPEFVLGRKEAIFGFAKEKGTSAINTILILSRYFIYQQKFNTKKLDDVHYINFIKDQLSLIYISQKAKNKEIDFIKDWVYFLDHFDVVFGWVASGENSSNLYSLDVCQ